MPKKSRYVWGVVVILLIILILSLIVRSTRKNYIPSDFSDSRTQASEYAKNIVAMISDAQKRINDIELVRITKTPEELSGTIESELGKNVEVKEKAVSLALQLEQMAKQIPDIRPTQAAQIALVAVSQETALIGKLISYNNNLGELLSMEQEYLEKGWGDYKKMNDLIKVLNDESKEINDLNGTFNEKMTEFDSIYEVQNKK